MDPLEQQVRHTILLALQEDRAGCDITSKACIPTQQRARAEFVLKQSTTVAGLRFLPWICQAIDETLSLQVFAADREVHTEGKILASIEGNAQSILAGERTALNMLQHACGIAQLTSEFVQAVEGYNCAILDTRKTLPGLRAIQKYAVTMGGGSNHRLHLEERFLIKNNHLRLLQETTLHPVKEAILRARQLRPGSEVEVEVEDLEMLQEALDAGAEWILLDNMTPALVAQAVEITQNRARLEASGGIHLGNVRAYAATGVHGISIGALTHSVKAIDISLRVHFLTKEKTDVHT